MALVTPSADASPDTRSIMNADQIAGNLFAGEDLLAVAPCYIKASDGRVYMSNGTAANEAAGTDGFTPTAYKAGQAVTLVGKGSRFRYGSGLTPGAILHIATTPGRLDDAATTGDPDGVAKVIDSTDIRVIRDF